MVSGGLPHSSHGSLAQRQRRLSEGQYSVGSNPTRATNTPIFQLGECNPYKVEVVGSSPTGCTNYLTSLYSVGNRAGLQILWQCVRLMCGVPSLDGTTVVQQSHTLPYAGSSPALETKVKTSATPSE